MIRPIKTVLSEALVIGIMNSILNMGLNRLNVPLVPPDRRRPHPYHLRIYGW